MLPGIYGISQTFSTIDDNGTTPQTCMDGIRKKLIDGAANAECPINVIHGISDFTESNIFDEIEAYDREIDDLYDGENLIHFVSPKWLRAMRTAKRAASYYYYYTASAEGAAPVSEEADETDDEFALELADGTISADDKKIIEYYAAGKAVKYRFGIRIGEDTYWGAEKQFGPSEPAYELYHAVEISAKTSGAASITLLHPLRAELEVALSVDGGTRQPLSRDSDTRFKRTGLTLPAGKTFTYAVIQPAHDDVPESILYESLPFNITTTTA